MSWLNFYHEGHEVGEDKKPFTRDLQIRLQNSRENFNYSSDPNTVLGVLPSIRSLMRQASTEAAIKRNYSMDLGSHNKKYSIQALVRQTSGTLGLDTGGGLATTGAPVKYHN